MSLATQPSGLEVLGVLNEYTNTRVLLSEFQNKRFGAIAPGETVWAGSKPIPSELIDSVDPKTGRLFAPEVAEYGITYQPDIGYRPQSYRTHLGAGMTTWGGVLAVEAMRQHLFKATTKLSTGLKVCYQEMFDSFEAGWTIPNSLSFEYPLGIDSSIPREQNLTYWSYKMGLKMGGMAIRISDASRVTNNLTQLQADLNLREAEAIAEAIDDNILDTLFAGVGGGTSGVLRDVATSKKWDTSGADEPDIILDYAAALSSLQNNSDLSPAEIMQTTYSVAPLAAMSYINNRPGISMGGTTTGSPAFYPGTAKVADQVRDMDGGVELHYTRNSNFANDVLLGYKGKKVAVHGSYSGNQIPLVEQQRIVGSGTKIIIKRFFNTKVAPYATGQTTNKNIGLITDIFAD